MHYYLYETKNRVNGKIYVGVHKTDDLNDGYLGSGKILRQAVEKYGVESFTKTILEQFETFEDALKREQEIVTEEFLAREDVYNLKCGGLGGWDWIVKNDLHKNALGKVPWNKGKKLPPVPDDVRERTSRTMKEYWESNEHPRKGKPSWNAGKKGVQVPWNKGQEMPKHTCPKCGQEMSLLNLKRWHGDKCKK
jgi:hypothetical protein